MEDCGSKWCDIEGKSASAAYSHNPKLQVEMIFLVTAIEIPGFLQGIKGADLVPSNMKLAKLFSF